MTKPKAKTPVAQLAATKPAPVKTPAAKAPAKPMSVKKVAEILGAIPGVIVTNADSVSVSDVKVEVVKKKPPTTPMKELAKVKPKVSPKPVTAATVKVAVAKKAAAATPVKALAKVVPAPAKKPIVAQVVKKENVPASKKTVITMNELMKQMQQSITAVAKR